MTEDFLASTLRLREWRLKDVMKVRSDQRVIGASTERHSIRVLGPFLEEQLGASFRKGGYIEAPYYWTVHTPAGQGKGAGWEQTQLEALRVAIICALDLAPTTGYDQCLEALAEEHQRITDEAALRGIAGDPVGEEKHA